MARGAISSPHPTRDDVLAFMFGKGTEEGCQTIGRSVHVRFVVWEYGVWHREARQVLKELAADGLVKYGGRGRHAAWWLTESGVKAAETTVAKS